MRSWMTAAVVALVASLGAAPASADKKKPGKGFYKVLVTPNASWVLKKDTGTPSAKDGQIIIETYDARKVGTADVARLRWTFRQDGTTTDLVDNDQLPTQVAVTGKGLYLLRAADDDAKIARTLATTKPSRSDPPKPYKGTKLNNGRFLKIRNGNVCMGWGPRPGDPACQDVCYAELCIDGTDGIVEVSGLYAPNFEGYHR